MTDTNAPVKSRLVIFLGTHAKGARYKSADVNESTDLLLPWNVWQHSAHVTTAEALPEIVVIGTRKTREDWLEGSRFVDDLKTAGHRNPRSHPVAFLHYDETKLLDPAGFWAFFESMRALLAGQAMAVNNPAGFEVVRGDQAAFAGTANHIIVDITHGFRSIPFLSGAVIDFVQTARLPVRHEILYTVLEEGSDVGTVRDLSLYTTAGRLNRALDAFTRHLQAGDLAEFLRDFSKIEACRALAGPVEQFSRDLTLLRVPNLLLYSGPCVHAALAEHGEALKAQFPPTRDAIGAFQRSVEELFPLGQPVPPVSLAGQRAVRILSEMLLASRHFTEVYCLLREAAVTQLALDAAPEGVELLQPDDDNFFYAPSNPEEVEKRRRSDSKQVEKVLGLLQDRSTVTWRADRSTHETWARYNPPNVDFFDVRNDVAHCSMRDNRKTPDALEAVLRAQVHQLRAKYPQ